MAKQIRFGTYIQEISLHQHRISYNQLAPAIERDRHGHDLPYRPARLTLRSIDVYRLMQPYVSVRLRDQI
ncbi:MAG: DUF1538 domain-containing protein, partial [Gammaproteobacteria bacterium]